MKVYLNGSYVDAASATISIDDRGFLFADGIYEVIRLYGGKPFAMDAHMRRLREGLSAVHIDVAPAAVIPGIIERLIDENGLGTAEATSVGAPVPAPETINTSAAPRCQVSRAVWA